MKATVFLAKSVGTGGQELQPFVDPAQNLNWQKGQVQLKNNEPE